MVSVERCKYLYDTGRMPRCIFFFRPSETPADKGVFSQWYMSDFTDGRYTYTSAEQYMMAQKALLFNDKEVFTMIMNENNPANLKKYGRLVKGFNQEVWDREKYNIVVRGNIMKFAGGEMRKALVSTGSAILVEASPYDAIWGIKMAEDNALINNPHNWKGLNLLGSALMDVREIYRLCDINA